MKRKSTIKGKSTIKTIWNKFKNILSLSFDPGTANTSHPIGIGSAPIESGISLISDIGGSRLSTTLLKSAAGADFWRTLHAIKLRTKGNIFQVFECANSNVKYSRVFLAEKKGKTR